MRRDLPATTIQMGLFEDAAPVSIVPPSGRPLAQKLASAVESVCRVLRAGQPVYIATSGGKDSTCCADIVLRAARTVKGEGGSPVLVAASADTLIENPEVTAHVRKELHKMAVYARRHDIDLRTAITRPTMAAT